jgi:hypothetical protein
MIEVIGGSVHTMNRPSAPPPNETIEDDMNLDELLKVFCSFKVYFRDKESCPFNRGNWIIDFFMPNSPILPGFSLKLPASMKKEEITKWLKPLTEKIKEIDS